MTFFLLSLFENIYKLCVQQNDDSVKTLKQQIFSLNETLNFTTVQLKV